MFVYDFVSFDTHTHRQTRTRARVCFLFVCVCSFYYEHICILENVGGGHDCRMYGKNKPMGPSWPILCFLQ